MSNSTTLITFMLHTNADVFSVELLGSWDNFDKPYQLSRDKRIGAGQWRGCHHFENIICDGDLSDRSLKRDGALKMGGTYWYYYRLNGDADYHDPKEPSTTLCPSLPGQSINVLDVPVQDTSSRVCTPNGSSTSINDAVFTLDPKDKYVPLGVKRAATTSAIQQRKARMHEERSLRPDDRPETACSIYEGPSLQRQRSLQSIFSKLRRTKSTSSSERTTATSRTGTSWSRRLFSRASRSRRGNAEDDVTDIPEVPKIPDDVLCLAAQSTQTVANQSQPATSQHARDSPTQDVDQCDNLISLTNMAETNVEKAQSLTLVETRSDAEHDDKIVPTVHDLLEPLESLELHGSSTIVEQGESLASNDISLPGHNDQSAVAIASKLENDGKQAQTKQEPKQTSRSNCSPTTHDNGEPSYAESTSLSYPNSEYFSPGLTSTVTATSRRMSSIYLSQPETPRTSVFDGEAVVWEQNSEPNLDPNEKLHSDFNRSDSNDKDAYPVLSAAISSEPVNNHVTPTHGSFHGFAFPVHDSSSAVTLKKPLSHHDIKQSISKPASTQQLVESWNDGVQHHLGGLPGLVDDLGYLGDWIS